MRTVYIDESGRSGDTAFIGMGACDADPQDWVPSALFAVDGAIHPHTASFALAAVFLIFGATAAKRGR